jgi:hypothetical protein
VAKVTSAKAGLIKAGWAGMVAVAAAVAVLGLSSVAAAAAGCSAGEKACSGKAKQKASAGLLDLS